MWLTRALDCPKMSGEKLSNENFFNFDLLPFLVRCQRDSLWYFELRVGEFCILVQSHMLVDHCEG